MKKSFLFFILVAALAMPSCLVHKYMTTPNIVVDTQIKVINDAGTDTIGVFFNTKEEAYSIDTVHVGDSVIINVAFDAVGNELTRAFIGYRNEYANLTVRDENISDSIITRTITEDSYTYDVVLGYRAIIFQLVYIPTHKGMGKLDFRVESNSEYSPYSLSLLTPIVDAVESSDNKNAENEEVESTTEQ